MVPPRQKRRATARLTQTSSGESPGGGRGPSAGHCRESLRRGWPGSKVSLDASDCNATVAAALDRGNVDSRLRLRRDALRPGASNCHCIAAVGTTLDQVILPETRKLPQKAVDIVAVQQKLLSQYDMLQSRLKDLKRLVEKRFVCLISVTSKSSAKLLNGRVKRVRKSLETTLLAKIELMESYAKLCSMIEIEVEMDLTLSLKQQLERISEQIEQLMEIDSLEEQWRIQAEANDEAERLLGPDSSEALSAERV
ncbi:hypothetical protein ZWY2020_003236 [Hordeum vulgare]|nr:hypothetical protein ZWY2020_003236 [Hordeum vulgare]